MTIQVCKIIRDLGKTPVVLTRLWVLPEESQLVRLANLGVVLHVSLCALDSIVMLSPRLLILKKYQAMKGIGVMRLVTFQFNDAMLDAKQKILYNYGGPVLEQPARLQRTNPNWDKVDQSKYHPYHTYTDKTETTRWWTAGNIFSGSACGDGCPVCKNKCFTKPEAIPPHELPKETINLRNPIPIPARAQ